MSLIRFELAGTQHPMNDVFLQARHRKYKAMTTIVHNNNKHTILLMPVEFFKEHFKFDHKTGTYLNNLKWGDLMDQGFVAEFHL